MSLAYYKRFPRDFLEGTIGLSFEEKGAYSIVLDLIYMRDGRLQDDPRYIAGQLNCSVRKWASIRDSLISKSKLTVQNGIISNFRANYLLEESRKYQDKQAENRSNPNRNNDVELPNAHQPEPEPESIGGGEVHAFPSDDDWPDKLGIFEGLDSVAGPGLEDRAKSQTLITSRGEVIRWRQAGCSWREDVLPTVQAITAKARGSPIKSWQYFTSAVLRSRDLRLSPLPAPQPVNCNERPQNNISRRQNGFNDDSKRGQLEEGFRRRLAAGMEPTG